MKISVCSVAFLLFLFFTCNVHAEENLPVYDLLVSFDIEKNLLKGFAAIHLKEDGEMNISVNDIRIISVKMNDQTIQPEIKDSLFKVRGKGVIEIVYEGIFRDENESASPENAGVATKNVVSDRGICLTNRWYPGIDGRAIFNLKALLPEGFTAISEADEVAFLKTAKGIEYSFRFPHPIPEITFIAARYAEMRETYNGIEIFGYFFPENIALAKAYIENARKYIQLYGDLIKPYPYKRFSVVENFLPTGYSMPTFTLLGQDVMRLPFIVDASLGHEILHQWFGNRVYVDYKAGNWSEGLTAYLSDHLYEEEKGRGSEFRKNILIGYESSVNPEKEFPLKNFTGRNDFASKAVGYGKGAMLFHMLKDLTGNDAFYSALKEFTKEKEFQAASWDDLRTAFEKASGKNLGWFFNQWLEKKGMPSIEVRDPRVIVLKGTPTVLFDILQNGETYILNLSVEIKTDTAEITEKIKIEKNKESFEIPVQGDPLEMIIDGNYDVMRKLSKDEYPPVISKLLGDNKRLIVVSEEKEKYAGLIDILKQEGFAVKEDYQILDEDIRTHSLLVFGFDGPVLKRLFGEVKNTGSGFVFSVRKNPLNISKVIAIAYGDSKDEVDLAAKKISHYGKYSYLRFDNGRNTDKQADATENGIITGLYEPVLLVQPQKTMKLDEVINTVLDKPVIYVGERHTNYEDHKVQLKIIMSLHERGRKFAIGMEMFQKPFQKAINDYMSGEISEKEFLKNTQYFKRWQFDYNLYREIIEYAKAKQIPVIALNLWTEITKKVSSDGLDGLADVERAEIPESMDMTDEGYKERLSEIFKQHRNHETRNFDNFYQSQVLWDEIMADSIDNFLRKNPDSQIVVLAGTGHIMYDSGIPKRTYRLNGKDYVTVIPGTEFFHEDSGDYLFSAERLPAPPTFKLGLVLREKGGRVEIDQIVPGSIAKSAGLEKGDILLSFDDWKIEDITDVNIFMFDKKRGEKFTVKVLRKRFLTGYKEVILNGTI
ncbi:MAG: PDZ domain-containing protein [Nitrospira sp.]|nr:PDZ domain-containing protein [Nitrospira sp.]